MYIGFGPVITFGLLGPYPTTGTGRFHFPAAHPKAWNGEGFMNKENGKNI